MLRWMVFGWFWMATSLCGGIFGGDNQTPLCYQVILTRIEFQKSNGSWKTFREGSVSFDVGCVHPGSVVGTWGEGVGLTPGTYQAVRVSIAPLIKIKTAEFAQVLNLSFPEAPSWNLALQSCGGERLPSGELRFCFPLSFRLAKGNYVLPPVHVDFDVKDSVEKIEGQFFLQVPRLHVSIS